MGEPSEATITRVGLAKGSSARPSGRDHSSETTIAITTATEAAAPICQGRRFQIGGLAGGADGGATVSGAEVSTGWTSASTGATTRLALALDRDLAVLRRGVAAFRTSSTVGSAAISDVSAGVRSVGSKSSAASGIRIALVRAEFRQRKRGP